MCFSRLEITTHSRNKCKMCVNKRPYHSISGNRYEKDRQTIISLWYTNRMHTRHTVYARINAWILNNMLFWIFNFRRSVFETDIKPADAIFLHSTRVCFCRFISSFFFVRYFSFKTKKKFGKFRLKDNTKTEFTKIKYI